VNRPRRQAGQASVILIGALVVGLAFAGLAIDGARLFTARRDLQSVADSAALAGASAIDEGHFRATAGSEVRLDAGSARAAADRVLQASDLPPGTEIDVIVEPDRVTVHLRRPVDMTFLRITGMRAQDIGASASASPQTG
jgi:hypothetical protein